VPQNVLSLALSYPFHDPGALTSVRRNKDHSARRPMYRAAKEGYSPGNYSERPRAGAPLTESRSARAPAADRESGADGLACHAACRSCSRHRSRRAADGPRMTWHARSNSCDRALACPLWSWPRLAMSQHRLLACRAPLAVHGSLASRRAGQGRPSTAAAYIGSICASAFWRCRISFLSLSRSFGSSVVSRSSSHWRIWRITLSRESAMAPIHIAAFARS
jgi:hypothetical protein